MRTKPITLLVEALSGTELNYELRTAMIVIRPKDIEKLRSLLGLFPQVRKQAPGIERVEITDSKVSAGKVRYLSNRRVFEFLRKYWDNQNLEEEDLPFTENDSIYDTFKAVFGIAPDMLENRFVVLHGDMSKFLDEEADDEIISSDVPVTIVLDNEGLHWLDVTTWGDDTVHISTQSFTDADLEKLRDRPPFTYVLAQHLSPAFRTR